jgi:hypothetical protein
MKGKWMTVVLSLALAAGLLGFGGAVYAQNPVTYSQDFYGIGTSATATLPTNWRVDKNTTVRTVGTWAGAGSATEQRAGNSMASNATNGIYNYGAGAAETATDRAVGWISSGSGTDSGNLYAYFQNGTGQSLTSVTISYDVEKYRNGSNSAGFRIQMYYSTDGSTWTSAGSDFLTSFPADANNDGFSSAPGATSSVSAKVLTFSPAIASGGTFYLAWNYSVASGSTTTNAQGLGIDNFSMDSPTAVTLAEFYAQQVADFVRVTWETNSELNNRGFNLYRGVSPAGWDTQLNSALIPSQSQGSPGGFVYTWEDHADLLPGTTYYYWLEDVELNGVATMHGPVSVDFVAPTAVTLSSVAASPAAGAGVLPWLLVVAAAGAALGVSRMRRENRG